MSLCLYNLALLSAAATAALASDADPGKEFERVGVPFIAKNCLECHGEKDPKGELSLNVYKNEKTVLNGRKLWYKALNLVASGEMPPPEKKTRPAQAETAEFVKSVSAI